MRRHVQVPRSKIHAAEAVKAFRLFSASLEAAGLPADTARARATEAVSAACTAEARGSDFLAALAKMTSPDALANEVEAFRGIAPADRAELARIAARKHGGEA